ncbi:amino acid ABC transporter permease [Natronoglycomyces albus]|uniref:ABC transporter permease subunit n=1 Tax=Natronoglycomyces albus TaxID=2811108 RepID=A0A895XQH5_9ACTN|nr:ABC transporter permease subunit [Natronoglycomyces albus]QSB05962.1 ABC transporter permease subunit [Natronoglycomyces albus]
MDSQRISDLLPLVWEGFVVILQLTFWAGIIALSLGLVIAITIRSAPKPVTVPLFWFTEFIRNTPLLVQALFVYIFVSRIELIEGFMTPFVTGAIVLGVHYACYCSEAYRAGIDGIPKGQWEAITAISLPKSRAWIDILIPQMMRRCTPALGNYMIAMFKEVPILFAIGVFEMIAQIQRYTGLSFAGHVEGYTLAGLLFLAISYPLAVSMRKLENRLARAHG